METYKNLSGNSGISAYEIEADSITVEFEDGHVYRYTYRSAGEENVEKMKELAEEGEGLNTFISQQVKDRYAMKVK